MSMNAFRWILIETLPSTSCTALARLTVPTSSPLPSSSLTCFPALALWAGACWTFDSVASLVPIFASFLQCLELRQRIFYPAGLFLLDLHLRDVRFGLWPALIPEQGVDDDFLVHVGGSRAAA